VLAGAAGRVARVLRDAFLPIFLRRQRAETAAWMHAHHTDWDTPVTTATPAGSR
jgi:FAD-dependent urate hydroxylase